MFRKQLMTDDDRNRSYSKRGSGKLLPGYPNYSRETLNVCLPEPYRWCTSSVMVQECDENTRRRIQYINNMIILFFKKIDEINHTHIYIYVFCYIFVFVLLCLCNTQYMFLFFIYTLTTRGFYTKRF